MPCAPYWQWLCCEHLLHLHWNTTSASALHTKQTEDHLHLAFQNSQQNTEHLLNSKTQESKKHYKNWNEKLCPDLLPRDKFSPCKLSPVNHPFVSKAPAHLPQGIVTTVLLTDIQMINVKTTQSIIIIIIIILYLHVININSNVDTTYFGESCCIWSIHLTEHNNAELFPMTLWKKYLTLTFMYSRITV